MQRLFLAGYPPGRPERAQADKRDSRGNSVVSVDGRGDALPDYFGLLSEAELAAGDPDAAADDRGRGIALGYRAQGRRQRPTIIGRYTWSRERNAKWIELNAGIRLARLWQADGHVGRARDLLAPAYGWFSECFDNPLLRDARALLEELADTFDSTAIAGCSADPSKS